MFLNERTLTSEQSGDLFLEKPGVGSRAAQLWDMDSDGFITNQLTGHVLSVRGVAWSGFTATEKIGSSAKKSKPTYQRWKWTEEGVIVLAAHPKYCIEVTPGDDGWVLALGLYSSPAEPRQRWRLERSHTTTWICNRCLYSNSTEAEWCNRCGSDERDRPRGQLLAPGPRDDSRRERRLSISSNDSNDDRFSKASIDRRLADRGRSGRGGSRPESPAIAAAAVRRWKAVAAERRNGGALVRGLTGHADDDDEEDEVRSATAAPRPSTSSSTGTGRGGKDRPQPPPQPAAVSFKSLAFADDDDDVYGVSAQSRQTSSPSPHRTSGERHVRDSVDSVRSRSNSPTPASVVKSKKKSSLRTRLTSRLHSKSAFSKADEATDPMESPPHCKSSASRRSDDDARSVASSVGEYWDDVDMDDTAPSPTSLRHSLSPAPLPPDTHTPRRLSPGKTSAQWSVKGLKRSLSRQNSKAKMDVDGAAGANGHDELPDGALSRPRARSKSISGVASEKWKIAMAKMAVAPSPKSPMSPASESGLPSPSKKKEGSSSKRSLKALKDGRRSLVDIAQRAAAAASQNAKALTNPDSLSNRASAGMAAVKLKNVLPTREINSVMKGMMSLVPGTAR